MTKVLMVLTSHTVVGDTERATGFHFEEMTTPYWAFVDAGIEVDIASIRGGRGAHDPSSLKADPSTRPDSVNRFLSDRASADTLARTIAIETVSADDYVGVFLPGGHGTMWDMPGSAALADVVGKVFIAGGAVGAVCHGPAGLVSARRADGRSIVAGRRVNAFTDAEEAAVDMTDVVPFLLETRLRELGGHFEGGPDFQPYAVRDGNLITGQNPASASLVAKHMVEAVMSRSAIAA